jgi:hypothetical protein
MYISLFMPSAIGLVLYTTIAGMVILLHQFDFIKQYLQIPREVDFLRMFTGWVDRVVISSFGESMTAMIVVGVFWAFVGLGVYIFLRGIAHFIAELSEGVEARSYLWPKGVSRNSAFVDASMKVAFRIFATIGLILMVLGPLVRLLDGAVFVDFIGQNAVLQSVVWFICMWLTLHVCVVLARLIVLKPRLVN